MTRSDASRGQVVLDAAEVYDQFFVPALFERWTDTVLDAAGVGPGDRVLDVGCGTGVLTRAAMARVGPSGAVVGLDPNPAMLEVARRHAEPIDWREGRGEDLPFADAGFDRVVSQFVLMFVDDPPLAAREFGRVLAPGGRVAVATWAAITDSPGYADMAVLLQRVVDDEAAAALRAPFCLGSVGAVTELLAPVFPEVEVARREGTVRFPSLEDWVHTEIRGWTLADRIDDATYERILDGAQRDLARYTMADGTVSFPIQALVAEATKPD